MDWRFPAPDTPEEAAELARRINMVTPDTCIYPETKEDAARSEVAVNQTVDFVKFLKRQRDGDGVKEFPELFAHVCNMTAPYYARLRPHPNGELCFGPTEHWLEHYDTIMSAQFLVIDSLRTQVFDGERGVHVNIQRMNILRRYFPDQLSQGMFTQEERPVLIETMKARPEEIQRAKSQAQALSKMLGFEISPESPLMSQIQI